MSFSVGVVGSGSDANHDAGLDLEEFKVMMTFLKVAFCNGHRLMSKYCELQGPIMTAKAWRNVLVSLKDIHDHLNQTLKLDERIESASEADDSSEESEDSDGDFSETGSDDESDGESDDESDDESD